MHFHSLTFLDDKMPLRSYHSDAARAADVQEWFDKVREMKHERQPQFGASG